MKYKVVLCDVGGTGAELDKLGVNDRLVACNYIGSLRNQLVIERTVIKMDETKTIGNINAARRSNSKNKK